jgi:mRNA-degrading endonuclease YafQ of YafQ-DinJ toxin-antitoxin module
MNTADTYVRARIDADTLRLARLGSHSELFG